MNPGPNGRQRSLKSPTQIAALFSKGKRHFQYPLILIRTDEIAEPGKVVFSVSKKKFKRAVDRNRVKRQLRAVYFSLQPHPPQFHLALVYVGNELMPSQNLAMSLKKLLTELPSENGEGPKSTPQGNTH
jgi:ribonuclease P protein component